MRGRRRSRDPAPGCRPARTTRRRARRHGWSPPDRTDAPALAYRPGRHGAGEQEDPVSIGRNRLEASDRGRAFLGERDQVFSPHLSGAAPPGPKMRSARSRIRSVPKRSSPAGRVRVNGCHSRARASSKRMMEVCDIPAGRKISVEISQLFRQLREHLLELGRTRARGDEGGSEVRTMIRSSTPNATIGPPSEYSAQPLLSTWETLADHHISATHRASWCGRWRPRRPRRPSRNRRVPPTRSERSSRPSSMERLGVRRKNSSVPPSRAMGSSPPARECAARAGRAGRRRAR
jgi:hypothetical protein